MPRIFKHLEAGCLQVNLMSTSAQINQLKYTILLYYTILRWTIRPLDYLAPGLFVPRTSNTTIPRPVIYNIFEKKSHSVAVCRFGKNNRSSADFKYDIITFGLQ